MKIKNYRQVATVAQKHMLTYEFEKDDVPSNISSVANGMLELGGY